MPGENREQHHTDVVARAPITWNGEHVGEGTVLLHVQGIKVAELLDGELVLVDIAHPMLNVSALGKFVLGPVTLER